MSHLEHAIDRVIAGPERKSRVMSERERQVIAYHEAGHALVGHVLPNCDPIHKVSIIARGRALGWTLSLPTEDKNLRTRAELRDQLAMALGGRSAEELIFGDPTTGAADDIEVVSQIARAMVTEYGMSDLVGPQQLGQRSGEVFLGRDFGHDANYSDQVASVIDAEVRRLIDEAHLEATEILRQHRPNLDRLAETLVENETLDEAELAALFDGLEPWAGTARRVAMPHALVPNAPGVSASSGPSLSAGVTPAIRAWMPAVWRWVTGTGARRALRPRRQATPTARPEVSR